MSSVGSRLVGVVLVVSAIVLGITVGPLAYNESVRLMQYYHIKAVEIERRAPDRGLEFLNWIWPIGLLGSVCLLLLFLGYALLTGRQVR